MSSDGREATEHLVPDRTMAPQCYQSDITQRERT
jgi:hypothetical protein